MSSQRNSEVGLSTWFVDDADPEQVVVRAVRYPFNQAALLRDKQGETLATTKMRMVLPAVA